LLKTLSKKNNWWFYISILLLIFYRFFHFDEMLDSPHTWRQSDTANYIWDFYNNGINLLTPAVCWMGGHKTLLLEYPLPEAIVSIIYKIFGPYHLVARSFFFVSFLVSALYLFKIIKLLMHEKLAQVSTVIYLALPISLFFSRTLHIDFFVIALTHAFFYYGYKGVRDKRYISLVIAGLLALIGIPIKSPYFLTVLFPMIFLSIKEGTWRYGLTHSYLLLPAIIIFVLWQQHVHATNSLIPDWQFIKGFSKFTDNNSWYFGTLKQRMSITEWYKLWQRFSNEILGSIGLILFIPSLILSFRNKAHRFVVFWLFGAIVYLMIFFNLNAIHNYYQIPFIAPIAILLGIGIYTLETYLKFKQAITILAVFLIGFESISYANKHYYKVQHAHMQIGEVVNAQTKADELSIITFHEMDSKCPNFLYAAKRNGWQIANAGVHPNVIDKLIEEGAQYYFYVHSKAPIDSLAEYLKQFERYDTQIESGYTVQMYHLNSRLKE